MKKKILITIGLIFGLIFIVFAISFPIIYNTVLNVDLNVDAKQVEQSQKIELNFQTSKSVDYLEITIKHNKDIVSKEYINDPITLNSGKVEINAIYGKITITIKAKKGIYKVTKKLNINLSADEYNIAPLTATMPVTLFSLNLNEITNNGSIPTFVWFKRSNAWNWSNLPQNIYPIPVATTTNEFFYSNQPTMYQKTSAWIKELYEINPSSKFNLYYNDFYLYGALDATIANNIPTENYKIVLLSDGTASFDYFNNHFDNENYQNEYNIMLEKYNKLKDELRNKKTYSEFKNYTISANEIREYAFVITKAESNVEWWLTRTAGTLGTNTYDNESDPIKKENSIYNKEIIPLLNSEKIKVKDLKASLFSLSDEEQIKLKNLYNFSDSLFEKAIKENKKVMVILGTWTQDEYEFDAYVNMVKTYYGNDYIYYYKGHPKNPTSSVQGKAEKLESLELIDINATIPAELIMFFHPQIYMSGYETTTFVSAENNEKCAFLFHKSKDSSYTSSSVNSYAPLMDGFLTKIDKTNELYKDLIDSNNTYYLVEFNNFEKYDIAIYCKETQQYKFYKLENSSFIEVQK